MKLKQLFTDDDNAVSPVIGVILMVAITVILAAVIATFVLGLGESVSDTAPQASFNADLQEYSGTNISDSFNATSAESANEDGEGVVTFTHSGGDRLEADDLYVTGSDINTSRLNWVDDTNSSLSTNTPKYNASDRVTAGNSIDYAIETDDTVRVIWDNGQGNSATLKTYTGPDA